MLDTGIFLTRKFDKSQTASLVKWNNSLRSFFFKCCIKLKQCLKARFLPAQIDNKTSSIKGKLIDVPCGKWCCPPLSPPTIHLDFSTLYFKPLHCKIYAQHNKQPKLPSSPRKKNTYHIPVYTFSFFDVPKKRMCCPKSDS